MDRIHTHCRWNVYRLSSELLWKKAKIKFKFPQNEEKELNHSRSFDTFPTTHIVSASLDTVDRINFAFAGFELDIGFDELRASIWNSIYKTTKSFFFVYNETLEKLGLILRFTKIFFVDLDKVQWYFKIICSSSSVDEDNG